MRATTVTLRIAHAHGNDPGQYECAVRGTVHLSPERTHDFLQSLAQALAADAPLPAFPSGKYAIAIRDTATGALYLATDWLGSEPLYYTPSLAPAQLHWSFDLKPLARLQTTRRVDLRALDEFFTYRWINEDRSMLQGIARVLPGRVIAWTPGQGLKEHVHTRKSYTCANTRGTVESARHRTKDALQRYFQASASSTTGWRSS